MSESNSQVRPKSLHEGYDCKTGDNCFLQKHLVDFTKLNEVIPGKNGFTDIDGVVDIDGRILFLEFKTGYAKLKRVQRILHENLSEKEGQHSLIIWRDREGTPTDCQWITYGKMREPIALPSGWDDLKTIIQTWRAL